MLLIVQIKGQQQTDYWGLLLQYQVLASLPLPSTMTVILAPNIWTHVTIYSTHPLYSSHTAPFEGHRALTPMKQTPYSWPLDGRPHPHP